jgi:guanylate kinase
MARQGILFVISAPSGGGKTTLCKRLVAEMPGVVQSVSSTTRAPRPAERHGREYYFLSRQDFEAHIAAGAFLEWARVHGHLYGTSRQQIEALTRAGTDVLLAIDVQGGTQLRASGVDAVLILLAPPSWQALEARLQSRASESAETRVRRLAVARQELAHYTQYDYVVINDQLAQATDELKAIMIAERHRVTRVDTTSIEYLLTHQPVAQALPD